MMLKMLDIKTAACRYGRMDYYARDKYIGYGLERYGQYSEAEVDLFRSIVHEGNNVVEAGANIGALTLPLSRLVGLTGQVYAFEPQPENYALLERNLVNNDIDNVAAFDFALGAEAATVRVPALWQISNENYGGAAVGDGELSAAMKPLDAVITKPVDVLKIDVEGMEADVIRGARLLINTCRPLIYVENDRDEKAAELVQLIASLDYVMFEHKPPIYNDKSNFRRETVLPRDTVIASHNLLCIPKAKASEYADVTDGLKRIFPEPPKDKGWACVVRLGGIGDDLVAASVLRPLKAQGYKIEVITQEPQSVVFENNPFIDKLSVRKHGDLPADIKAWGDHFRFRASEYAKFINLSHSMEGLLAMFEGSMAWDWPADFRRKMCDHSYLETAHDIVGVPHQFGPMFFPTQAETETARHTLRTVSENGARKVVAWCLAGSRLDKVYPQTPLVIARIIKELGAAVVMFGAPGRIDFAMAKTVQDHVKLANGSDAGLHLALSPEGTDTWPIRRALSTVIASDLVITPDSGLAWGAAMESVPKIMLHSHASQANITKHWVNTISMIPASSVTCWPCHKLHNVKESCEAEQRSCGMKVDADAKGAACITSISVDDIIRAARHAIGASG